MHFRNIKIEEDTDNQILNKLLKEGIDMQNQSNAYYQDDRHLRDMLIDLPRENILHLCYT